MIDDLLLRSINFIALVLELSPFSLLFFFYLSYIYVKHSSIIPGYRNYYQISYTFKRLVSLAKN